MKDKFPYITFMDILKNGREKMINDTKYNCSPTLYDALYSSVNSEIFKSKMELYELEWLEFHWREIVNIIEQKNFNEIQKRDLLSIFASWLSDFIDNQDKLIINILIIEEKINILKSIISLNSEWEQNLKKMKVSFEKSRRQLNMKIKQTETGGI